MVPNDPETLVMTNLEPFDKTLKSSKEYRQAAVDRREVEIRHSGFENLIRNPPRKGLFGQPGLNTFTMAYYLYPKTQQLCRGDTVMKNLFNETK
jgi:hypothetical protein